MGRSYTKGDEPIPGYQLKNFLGRGGFGEVWKASAPGGMEAAIKIINLGDKQGLKEFRAIRLVKFVRHPNLVPINAFWLKDENDIILGDASEEPDSVWLKAHGAELIIAMGLGDKNLYDRLKECRDTGLPGVPAEELLDYMEAAARAIDYLNQPTHKLASGVGAIQHCDIKPQNILIVGGSVQVCDFGLARVLDADARTTSEAAGSYAYIAPELIDGARPSRTTDQYSLAISYVELRTGSFPFKSSALYEVMLAKVKGKLDFSALSEAEQTVLKRATAVEPSDRYPTTSEMVKALRKAIEGHVSSKTPGTGGGVKSHEHLQAGVEIVPFYKLVRPLGRGGYGEVWEAVAPGGKHVALKIIGNLAAIEGKQEFKALELIKGVDHHHLMELHAYWLLDSTGAVIPDEVRGKPGAPEALMLVIATKLANKNLLQRLKECRQANNNEGGIPLGELVRYLRQAAEAIDYLNMARHQLGDRLFSIQHRDIKPENILLTGSAIKVSDFGLAKVLEGTSAIIHGDSTGRTDAYAAPEIFSNKVTAWSDQYSLAITYYYLRTGKMPFTVSSPMEIMLVHVNGNLDLHLLPEGEREVIERATALKPENRFPTCVDMVTALELVTGYMRTPTEQMHYGVPGRTASGPGDDYTSGAGSRPARPSEPTRSDPDSRRSGDRPPGPKSLPPKESRPAPAEPRKSGPSPMPGPARPAPSVEPSGYESVAFIDLQEHLAGSGQTDEIETSKSGNLYTWETQGSEPPVPQQEARAPQPGLGSSSSAPRQQKPPADGPTADVRDDGGKARITPAGGLRTKRVKKKSTANWVVPVVALCIVTVIVGGGVIAVIYRNNPKPASTEQGTEKAADRRTEEDVKSGSSGQRAKAETPREGPEIRGDGPSRQTGFKQKLAEAALLLSTDPKGAAIRFEGLLNGAEGRMEPPLQVEARLGLAQAQARLDRWADVPRQLETLEPASQLDAAIRTALLLLAKNQGAVLTAERRAEINNNVRDALLMTQLASGEAKWEADKLRSLRERMIAELKTQIQKTKDEGEWEKLVTELKRYEPNNSEFATERVVRQALERARKPDLTAEQIALEARKLDSLIRARSPRIVELCQALADLCDRSSEGGVVGNLEFLGADVLQALPPAAQAQMHYVQALAYGARSDFPKAADELVLAGEAVTEKGRTTKAIGILSEAIKPLRQPGDSEHPFGSPGNAARASDLLNTAKQLAAKGGVEVPADVEVGLALAAAGTGRPADAVALVKKYWPDKIGELGEDGRLLVLLSARDLAATDKSRALAQYAWLAEKLKPSLGEERERFELYYTTVLVPAQKLGEELSAQELAPKLKLELAGVHAKIGSLVRENVDTKWLKKELGNKPPLEIALAAYRKAVELDEGNIDYRIGRALTQLDLPDPDLKHLLTEAQSFKQNSPEVHNLRGFIHYQLAGTEKSRMARTAKFAEALADYDLGLDLIQKNNGKDPVLPTLLTNRAVALVQLGNFTSDEAERKKFLHEACRSAEAATKLNSSYPEYSWEALGNAREDVAWLLGETEEYAKAIQAFSVAINKLDLRRSDRKQPKVDRGRCLYRWALSKDPPDQKRLEDALIELRQVANSKEAVKAERVEAFYFLGLVQEWVDKEKGNAEASLRSAVALDEDIRLGVWARYALEVLFDLKLSQGEFDAALKLARDLEKRDPRRGNLLAARSWHVQRKMKESWEILKREVPTDLAAATEDDVDAMVEAAWLFVDDADSTNELKDESKSPDYPTKLAEAAARLAPKDSLKRAEAEAAAGKSRFQSANAPGTDDKTKAELRQAGVAALATAIRLDRGCRAPRGWEWRLLCANAIYKLGDAAQKGRYKDDMVAWLKEAERKAPANPPDYRKYIRELRDALSGSGQDK